jgi:prepilin-type N-terminal cleavage/methylation domain-containing protein
MPRFNSKRKARPQGFTLMECLLSVAVFGFISLAGLEFFDLARRSFLRLQSTEQIAADLFAAADVMTRDIHAAGAGLQTPCRLRLLDPLEREENSLLCRLSAEEVAFQDDLFPGQRDIPLSRSSSASKGCEICVFDGFKGERVLVVSASKSRLKLSSPLQNAYGGGVATILLIKKIAFYHDGKRQVLRRRVNRSPAQPLCEETDLFSFSWDESGQVLSILITAGGDHGLTYEANICPKNRRLLSR